MIGTKNKRIRNGLYKTGTSAFCNNWSYMLEEVLNVPVKVEYASDLGMKVPVIQKLL